MAITIIIIIIIIIDGMPLVAALRDRDLVLWENQFVKTDVASRFRENQDRQSPWFYTVSSPMFSLYWFYVLAAC